MSADRDDPGPPRPICSCRWRWRRGLPVRHCTCSGSAQRRRFRSARAGGALPSSFTPWSLDMRFSDTAIHRFLSPALPPIALATAILCAASPLPADAQQRPQDALRRPGRPNSGSAEVAIRGRLSTGVMAIGGETTGTTVEANGITFELDLNRRPWLRRATQRFDGRRVLVEGELHARRSIERGQRLVVRVERLEGLRSARRWRGDERRDSAPPRDGPREGASWRGDDRNERDRDGRDRDARDRDGRDRDGRDRDGRDRNGRDRDGRDRNGRDRGDRGARDGEGRSIRIDLGRLLEEALGEIPQ